MIKRVKKYGLLLLAIVFSQYLMAHNINNALKGAPANEVAGFYLQLGFAHIIPLGADHILFIVGICLLQTSFKKILWQTTAFTLAHTITLALSMKGIVVAPPVLIEPVIALSIAFVAIENFFIAAVKPWRLLLVFLFGLVHGLGFASVLNEIGLPPDRFTSAVIFFNLGVELGQLAVIALFFLLLALPFKKRVWYHKAIVYPLSGLIACIAIYWTIERVMS
jgi:HupE / UreJ protein